MRVRAILALAVAAVAMFFVAPAAGAAPSVACPPYPPSVGAALAVSTTNPQPGDSITVTGSHFVANASVRLELHTTVVVLKTVQADASGDFTTTVTLPDGVTGTHTIVAATGVPTSGDCATPTITITIQNPGPNGGGGTSFTGVDVLAMVIGALALLGVGIALTRSGKRRKPTFQGEL
jgi:hypothetical protein